jgi:hypothetical protein
VRKSAQPKTRTRRSAPHLNRDPQNRGPIQVLDRHAVDPGGLPARRRVIAIQLSATLFAFLPAAA